MVGRAKKQLTGNCTLQLVIKFDLPEAKALPRKSWPKICVSFCSTKLDEKVCDVKKPSGLVWSFDYVDCQEQVLYVEIGLVLHENIQIDVNGRHYVPFGLI